MPGTAPTTQVTGAEKSFDTQGYGTTTSSLVRDVGSKIFYADPSANPFTLLSDRAGSKVASNPKFEWFEKTLRSKNDQLNNGAGYTAGDTSIVVDAGSTFQINDLVYVVRTGEIVRVTNVVTNTLTVVRGAGGTTPAALVDNDDLFVVGSSWQEGVDVGTPDTWLETQKWNVTQIFRRPFGASRTLEGAESYIGQNRPRTRAEKAIEHAIDMERAFMFGSRADDTANKIRFSGGFEFFATSNIKDAGGTLTENEIEDWLADVFQTTAGSDSRVLLAAPKIISVIDQLAAGRLQMVPKDKTYGIAVSQWITSHGSLNIVKHRLMENGASQTFRADRAYAVDPKMLMYRPYTNGATKLLVDRQAPGVDGWVDEYLTESGVQVMVPKVHGILKNVTG